jgi:hypothetical protein
LTDIPVVLVTDSLGRVHRIRSRSMNMTDGVLTLLSEPDGKGVGMAAFAVGQWISCVPADAVAADD